MTLRKYNNAYSITSSSETDSDDKYYSSSSIDRSSSVGSIPWAEDAIKKNQQTWEKIERIFRGEEDLPDDDKDLRREILEWKTAFPQPHTIRNKVSAAAGSTNSTPVNMPEEIVSIPPFNKESDIDFNRKIVRQEKKSAQSLYTFPNPLDDGLSKKFEKDFRISSVPIVHRRKQLVWTNKPLYAQKQHNEKAPLTSLTKNHFQRPDPTENYYAYNAPLPHPEIVQLTNYKLNQLVRMPPIINIIAPIENPIIRYNHHRPTKIYVASSSSSNLNRRPNYHLPSMNVNHNHNIERSISAALNNHRQISAATTYIPFSASKLKYSK